MPCTDRAPPWKKYELLLVMIWSRQEEPVHQEQVAEIIRLRDVEHASWRQIAERLNMSRTNAWHLYRRWKLNILRYDT
jgi:hypothetical protein